MAEKKLTEWQIVAEHGGGICVMGLLEGKPWQTTTITGASAGMVKTASGSVYLIDPKDQKMGMWRIPLQMKRPEIYEKLLERGVF